jgi:Helix-turn-helix domain
MEQLLSAWDVARLLQINAESVKDLARAGKLAGSKICNRWRFRPSDIEQFIVDGSNRRSDNGVVQSEEVPRGKEKQWLSSNAVKCGGVTSESRVDQELESLLAQGTGRRRKNSTTN